MDSFGLERSIEPRHALAQQAWKIDNTMTLRSDEVLIDVKIININLASFNEILDETGEDRALLCQRVLEIVRERGKLHNPVTNSGGMLYGTVVELGPSYPNIYHIRPKDEIISLSSLTVTPLHITQILRIDYESAQLEVEGQAILYANSPVVKKPPDLPLRAVIAAMDEAGAPTRSYQIVQPGRHVLREILNPCKHSDFGQMEGKFTPNLHQNLRLISNEGPMLIKEHRPFLFVQI